MIDISHIVPVFSKKKTGIQAHEASCSKQSQIIFSKSEVQRSNKTPKNIQHWAFAGRHRPDYYSSPHWLIYGRADGIPSFPMGMVVCGRRRESSSRYWHLRQAASDSGHHCHAKDSCHNGSRDSVCFVSSSDCVDNL
ncbi:hypothetical protein K456DRAFT_57335 [Colletotrichum gloeosporioides 23]|nr:hypothetical protein K456DRAFT_57335 [Colletotrichum gloeosporioides 23]